MRDAVITNLINNIIFCIWMYALVTNHRFRKAVTALISVGAMIVYSVLFIVIVYSFSEIVAMLLFYWIAVFFYSSVYTFLMQKEKIRTSLFFFSTYLCLWGFIYMMQILTADAFFGDGNPFIWGERIVLNAIFLVIYYKFIRKKMIKNIELINNSSGILFSASGITFLVFTLIIFVLTVNQSAQRPGVKMAGFLVTFLLIAFVCRLIFRALRQAKAERELQQVAVQNKLLLETVQSYEQMERQIMQSRHDFRHHNLLILEYAKAGNCDAIIRYLGEYEQAEEKKICRRFTAHKLVDSILRAYSNKAEQEGIEIETDIRIPASLAISDVDLVAIIANILENAINGCKGVEKEQKITFTMEYIMKKIIIKCQNPCGEVEMKNGMPVKRGIGIMSIKATAEKYGGDLKLSAENEVFNCGVILNNTN